MKNVIGYIASIIAANYATQTIGMVNLGFAVVTAGTFFAGAALVFRDGVQEAYNKNIVVVAILVGSALSYLLSDPFIALASGIAFLVSEAVDFGVFTPVKEKSLSGAVLLSSVVSAPVDTILFLHLAGFGVTLQAVIGQFVVKTAIAGAVAWKIRCFT